MSVKTMSTTPSGSIFYRSPNTAGYVGPNGNSVNEFIRRDTSPSVHVQNFGDLRSLDGPFRVQKVVVGSTEVVLPSGHFPYRNSIGIFNTSSDTVYISHETGVTTANGWPIIQNTAFVTDMKAFFPIFAVSAGSSDIRIIEIATV